MDYSTMALLIIIHVYINYDKKKNFHNLNFFFFFISDLIPKLYQILTSSKDFPKI